MNLSLLHAEIAILGAAAAAVPIILHLLLRQQPRPILFPALQLIRKKQVKTVRRLKLRQWLLLAMRVLLLLLLGLALARPTLRSTLFSIDQQAPIASVFIFDNSLSMEYKERGKTRLEAAKELAETVLRQMPENSEITILESAIPIDNPPIDIGAALQRIDGLTPQAVPRSLNDALLVAYRNLTNANHERREVYIFTDMASHAWNEAGRDALAQAAGALTDVRVYVLNVGAEKPTNMAIRIPDLSRQATSAQRELRLTAQVSNAGKPADQMVEFTLDGQPRDTKAIRLPANQAVELSFQVPLVDAGIKQGAIKISSADPLAFDDICYFTVAAEPPTKILVVADQAADSIHWVNALAPRERRQDQNARFDVRTISTTDWEKDWESLSTQGFRVVCLLNVERLSPQGWQRLSTFVRGGGGLFVALGERVDPVSYNSPPAQGVLPGKLEAEVGKPTDNYMAPERFSHPLLGKFRAFDGSDLPDLPVFRYWRISPAVDAQTVVPYSSGDPAIIERSFGGGSAGRSVLLSTAAHYRPSADTWSELPLGWSYVVLADQVARYLAGLDEGRLNYLAGDNVVIGLRPSDPFTVFSVTDPKQRVERLARDPRESALTIPGVKMLGQFQVDAQEGDRSFSSGFSVNEPESESVLTPIESDRLVELIGKERVAIARDPDSLEQVVGEGRVGRELFPYLIVLAMLLICAEGYLANRFYRRSAS